MASWQIEAQSQRDFNELYQYQDDTEILHMSLPDLEETQVWQKNDEIIEIVLYLKTVKVKVQGPELTPFEMPKRWTFETLMKCVRDFISRKTNCGDSEDVEIDQLYYYYRKSRGKAVVLLNSDHDISALMNEYPLALQKDGTKKAKMYLAADYRLKNQSSSVTPRRSPRIARAAASSVFDIFVHEIGSDMKVSPTSNVIHDVSSAATLNEIVTLLRTYDSSDVMYNPQGGLYWLRKNGKQPVGLRNEQDLKLCKNEYKGQSPRIACSAVNLSPSTSQGTTEGPKPNRKRRLEMPSTSANKSENDAWNDTHIQLVRDLEKRGTMWRYSAKHLSLWTDQILEGNSSGVNEEPNWEKHIEAVLVPPKSRRTSTGSPSTPTQSPQSNNILETLLGSQSALMLQMLQTTCRSPTLQVPMPMHQMQTPERRVGKEMGQMTVQECINMVQALGLSKYASTFQKNDVDGPMLEAFLHPQFGKQLMLSMEITEADSQIIVPELFRLKSRGYNNSTSTRSF